MTSLYGDDVIDMTHGDRKWSQTCVAIILIPIKTLHGDLFSISNNHFSSRDNQLIDSFRIFFPQFESISIVQPIYMKEDTKGIRRENFALSLNVRPVQ